jgi:hypothetical protein
VSERREDITRIPGYRNYIKDMRYEEREELREEREEHTHWHGTERVTQRNISGDSILIH